MPEIENPPTPRPTCKQGPWWDEITNRWWVVADHAHEALKAIYECDPDTQPRYFGWKAVVEPVLIAWHEDYDGEEVCIQEQRYETEATVEAWRVSFEGHP